MKKPGTVLHSKLVHSAGKPLFPAFAFLLLIGILMNRRLGLMADDFSFIKIFREDGNIINWLSHYWNIWSGRVLPHALLVFFLNLPPLVFNILNAVLTTVLIGQMAFYAVRGRKIEQTSGGAMLIFAGAVFHYLLIPAEISSITAFWRTAAILYVWGTVAFLFALYPIYRFYACGKDVSAGWKIASFFCAFYAAGFEETGAFFCALAFILLIAGAIKRKRLPACGVLLWAFGTLVTFFFILAPGNTVRFKEEILYWMPYYGSFSIMNRLFLGISHTQQYTIGFLQPAMIVLSATVFAAMMFLKRPLLVRAVSGLTFAYFLLSLFSKNIPVLYAYADVDSVFAYGLSNWIASFIGLFMIFTLFFVMLLFSGRGNGAFPAFIFCRKPDGAGGSGIYDHSRAFHAALLLLKLYDDRDPCSLLSQDDFPCPENPGKT